MTRVFGRVPSAVGADIRLSGDVLPAAAAAHEEQGVKHEPHIALKNASKVFASSDHEVVALGEFSLEIARRQFVSILGPSGCGKSTLLRVVGGLLQLTSGEVLVNGRPPKAAQRAKEIGYVFQTPALLPWRTVLENVELPLEVNRWANRERPHGSMELLELVGLSDFRNAYPHELSGGMQQRVAIARALVFYPSILLMDEPFGSLDQITRDALRYELLRIWSRATKTVLFVTHSITEAVALSDVVVVMAANPGRVRAILPIELPRPRDEAAEHSQRFLEYVIELKELLRP